MPMMYSGHGLPDSASDQDALDYAKGQLMIAGRGYEVSSDGLERILGAPVTGDTQFAADALSKRMQDCTSLGALIEHAPHNYTPSLRAAPLIALSLRDAISMLQQASIEHVVRAELVLVRQPAHIW